MGSFKIGAECCNNCIHWDAERDDRHGSDIVFAYSNCSKCTSSHGPRKGMNTLSKNVCPYFRHIWGVQRTFPLEEAPSGGIGGVIDSLDEPNRAFLQATMDFISARSEANERIARHNREVAARNREVFVRNGMDPDADDQETFELLYRDACNGGGRDIACLAEAFLSGEHGALRDKAKAVRLFKQAAQKGCVEAEARLAYCYFNGEGVSKSDSEGRRWLERAATHGDSSSRKVLAEIREKEEKARRAEQKRKLCEKGLTSSATDSQMDRFESLLDDADMWGDSAHAAEYKLGIGFYKGTDGQVKDLERAFDWLKKAAAGKHVDAMFRVGYMYYFGEHVQENEPEAFKWFKEAAEKGSAGGMCRLGECYFNGRGCEKDLKSGREWYVKAAEKGNALAQMNVGTIYHDGIGVDQDYGESVKWFRKAADQGRADAMRMMGQCYDKGEGALASVDEAIVWYDKAGSEDDEIAQKRFREMAMALTEQAKSGDALAQNRLGMVYHLGAGIMQDYEVAMQWFKIARANGNVTAMANIGRCYLYGKGVAEDEELAVEWFKIAAKKGSISAQQELSSCYTHGWGVVKDDEVAAEWKRIAVGNTQGVL